jgi:hypothetical protein
LNDWHVKPRFRKSSLYLSPFFNSQAVFPNPQHLIPKSLASDPRGVYTVILISRLSVTAHIAETAMYASPAEDLEEVVKAEKEGM